MVHLFSVVLVLSTVSYSHAEVRLPPNIIEPSKATELYYPSNTNFVIKCKAESKPDNPTYKWLKGTTTVVPNEYVKYDATTGDLSFTSFSKREEGVYMCLASTVFTSQGGVRITAGSFSPTVTVYQFRVDPFTDTVPTSKAVDEYSYANLECSNKGEVVGNDVAINWYKDHESKQVDTDGGRLYVDRSGNLHFTYVKKSDATAGFTYICGISSPNDKVTRFGRTITLSVKDFPNPTPVKPQIQYTNNNVQAKLYGQAILECVFSGYHPQPPYIPRIKWSSDDGKEITGNTKYSISNDGRTLTISAVTEQDERNYYCSAENGAGSVAPQPVFLNVTSAPIFVEALKDQTVSEGKDVVFNCDARSASNEQAPSPPTWYINGEVTGPHTDRTKYIIDNKKLTVKAVSKARDILCVQCSVTNSQGTVWGDGCLNVLLPITIKQQPLLEQSIDHGDVIDLTIVATTDESQTLSYKWLHFQNRSSTEGVEPRFLTVDPVTHTTIINTSLLMESEYETVGGTYRRIISHSFDSVSVDIIVKLKDKPVPEEAPVQSGGIDMWIIGLIIGILFLIIVIIIIIFVICRKQQEGDYNVDKKETRAGLDPEKELKDKGFSEYSRPAYDTDYDYPDKKPRVDLEYDDGPIGDDESLGEYGDEEDTHFNEDGSFIGIYQKKDPQQKAPLPNESTI